MFLPKKICSGQACLLDLCLLAVQPQLEVLAVVMVAEVLPQEPSFPLRVLALALLEDRQDPLPPLLGHGEVPHHQLHHQQVLVARWDTATPPPAGRLAGGRQDAAQGVPALPKKAEANQDRAQGLPSKVGRFFVSILSSRMSKKTCVNCITKCVTVKI